MAKTKKNRVGLSEKIAIKSQKKKTDKLNPFDVRFVKSKQKVLGRREKTDVGKPGVSRARAIQKVTLLVSCKCLCKILFVFCTEERDTASRVQIEEQEQSLPGQENRREGL